MTYTIEIPDISRYEPNIEWNKVKARFPAIIIKASQGTVKDPDFQRLWKESKDASVPRGAYHLYDGLWSSNKPSRQAEIFVETLNNDFGELPLFLDIETPYAANNLDWDKNYYVGWQNWYDFIERLKQLVPNKEIMIYTSAGSWNGFAPTNPAQLSYFTFFNLWVANYKTNEPTIPRGWTSWDLWQYTEEAIVDGIWDYYLDNEGKIIPGSKRITSVDLNYWKGTLEEFKERFSLDETQPIPPDNPDDVPQEGDAMYTITPKYSNGNSIRPAHSTNNTKVDVLRYGEDAKGSLLWISTGEIWLRLTEIRGVPVPDGVERWIASRYNNEEIAILTQVGQPSETTHFRLEIEGHLPFEGDAVKNA